MESIGVYKLVTGEEIVGKVVGDTDTYIMMEDCLRVQVVQQGPQQYGVALVPMSPVVHTGKMRVFKNAIAVAAENIPDELVKEYTRLTSNIEIVTSIDGLKG